MAPGAPRQVEVYADTPSALIGPGDLRAVCQGMIDRGWCRSVINKQVCRIKRVFKWGGAHELVPPDVYHGLQLVEGLELAPPEVLIRGLAENPAAHIGWKGFFSAFW